MDVRDDALRQQLRPLPAAGRKLIPLAVTNVLRGRKGPGLRRRPCSGATGCTCLTTAGRSTRCSPPRRPPVPAEAAVRPELLPVYDVSARHEGDEPGHRGTRRAAPGQGPRAVDRARRRPSQPRPPLPHRAGEAGSASSAGARSSTSRRAWRRPSTGTRENEAWWRDVLRRKGELQADWAGARQALPAPAPRSAGPRAPAPPPAKSQELAEVGGGLLVPDGRGRTAPPGRVASATSAHPCPARPPLERAHQGPAPAPLAALPARDGDLLDPAGGPRWA